MAMYDGFMPKVATNGKRGYFPVSSAEEWDNLPDVYKSMQWFPIEMRRHGYTEKTFAEYLDFDVIYMLPYKVHATIRVHVQEAQKILFCLFNGTQCNLYTVCGVVFQNGEYWPAKWYQDSITGAFSIYAEGKTIGTQGGYLGFIPSDIEKTADGTFRHNWNSRDNVCHYQISNPFR